ncbi:hypothetical protein MK805_12765 [Shimazuella sp. AN120528]|uniref:hypothetical protein n=1 Tax=Shimazuella soli TaxID=1892854 RepID=UPI001F104516|nr:hypothetical protein [Shimazuella soli]MCH5585814.1 hypothetical protein [Shimazuella soli]
MVEASASDQILQAGIDLIKANASTVEEIETYYWKSSEGEVYLVMNAKCEELLGVRLDASHPIPYDAYLACIMEAFQQGR